MERAVSVLVPTYKSCETLPALAQRICQLTWFTSDSEVIFIDDGNADKTWAVLLDVIQIHPFARAIRLSRNVGQHAALLAGIREARHPVIATLDDDLQNPPEEIASLLAMLVDDIDVVYGVPKTIKQSPWRAIMSVTSKRLMRRALGFSHATNISSFRVFRTRLRDGFSDDLGPGVSIDALLNWSTSRFTTVEVEHHPRTAGRSNYTFWKLLRFLFDTITGYSTLPLRAATGLGFATITLSFGVLVLVLVRPIMTGESVPGFPFLAATIAIFSGTQLVVLGILGQYIGRMHFRVMNKPTYTIAERTEGK